MITGKDLIALGYEPGKHFGNYLKVAQAMATHIENLNIDVFNDAIEKYKPEPKIPLNPAGTVQPLINLSKNFANEYEESNYDKVLQTMTALLRTPHVVAGAIMPDSMPAGPVGIIPVGGVVSSTKIHPGMHSADVCCSVAITIFEDVDPALLMDAVHKVTHFGPRKRSSPPNLPMPDWLLGTLDGNPFFKGKAGLAKSSFGTQGDGNHFAYVGTMKSTGKVALVTHHGSRGLGAQLYKDGMRVAEKLRKEVSPETFCKNAWIEPESEIGQQYWDALQRVRVLTRENHYAIHDAASEELGGCIIDERFWNEHNFVFQKSDGLFYHAKGATPAYENWSNDATDKTIIPLNMSQPILIAKGKNSKNSLGFSPHGAGRNYTRSEHMRIYHGYNMEDIFKAETKHIDARFYSGNIDISELPSAYKDADTIRREIEHFQLADIVDEVLPYGCVMAGDWEKDAHWRKKKDAKFAEKMDAK